MDVRGGQVPAVISLFRPHRRCLGLDLCLCLGIGLLRHGGATIVVVVAMLVWCSVFSKPEGRNERNEMMFVRMYTYMPIPSVRCWVASRSLVRAACTYV
jgi:hypothetical protein